MIIVTFRERFVEFVAEKVLFRLAAILMKPKPFPFSINELCDLPRNTVGYALGQHMRKNQIEFIPGFESHDIKHLFTGFGIEVTDEIRLAFFELGNGIYSFTNFVVILAGVPLTPDVWKAYPHCFKRGRRAKKMENLNSEQFLLTDFIQAKHELFRSSLPATLQ